MPVRLSAACVFLLLGLLSAAPVLAQFGGGFGGFGGGRTEVALVERYDADGDGRLNRAERDLARGRGTAAGVQSAADSRGGTADAAPELTTEDVKIYDDEPLYAPDVLRTLFIDFEYGDWESELEDFYDTDVEVPATITVDGRAYPDVGIHFRGNTSFSSIPRGYKRGLNLSFNFVDDEQRLLGYRTLNLLNGFGDPTFLRQVLYLRIANEYYPAPKANFVRVVINGQDWGVYVNVQQFNSDFTREAADSNEARWHVQGSFSSRGGLEFLGADNEAAYRREYEIKSKDEPENWRKLIELTRVLNQTPIDQLIGALDPIFDIDGALRYLAVDNVLLNSDGYWARNSDYSIYLDENGRFHVTNYDANEVLRESMGRRGSGGGGVRLSPLEGSRDGSKAMLYRMLMVPELRERYLGYVRDIAETWLDWDRLGPIIDDYRSLIGDAVAADERKLYTTQEFELGVDGVGSNGGFGGPGAPPGLTLKGLIEQRQAFLLEWLAANAGASVL